MILDLDFYSGYLLHFIAQVLQEEGPEESGLHNYYAARVASQTGMGIHEMTVARYIAGTFATDKRCILHVGIGIGTLSTCLAVLGYQVTGFEYDRKRFSLAQRLRKAVTTIWPEVASRLVLVNGFFPEAADGLGIIGKDSLILFTNAVHTWPDDTEAAMLQVFPRVGDVILDVALFGQLRESESDQEALLERVVAVGPTKILQFPGLRNTSYHFQFE